VTVDDEVAAFVRGGVAAIVATRDAELRPELGRAWGIDVLAGGTALTLCVELPPGSRTRANLEDNGAIAATFSLPTTYRTIQIKGIAREVRAPTPEDRARVDEHAAAFARETGAVGLSPVLAQRLLDDELVAVTFDVQELFDQTPGPTAGTRL
jgi:hypothetical protein